MEKELSSFSLKSHPDKLLLDHLKETKENAEVLMKNLSFLKDRDEMKRLIKIIVISHDFGKSSNYFQKNISEEENVEPRLSEHSLISAFLGYYLVENSEFNELEESFAKASVFNAIKHHHGNLEDLEKTVYLEDKEYLLDIWESILENREEVKRIYQELSEEEIDFNGFDEFLRNRVFDKNRFRIVSPVFERKAMFNQNTEHFFKFNLIYSILLESDKKSASGVVEVASNFEPQVKILDSYKNRFDQEDEFNMIREKIYRETIDGIESSWENHRFFELDAPTGSGKTLTLLGAAFKISEKLRNEKGKKPRIIYSLPFISIIEQNSDVFADVIQNSGVSVNDEVLLEHHHLADEVFKTRETDYDYSKSSFLIENWYSDIIVTTFYQLFKTIYTNKNHLLKKYNKLSDSIILIDEIQAIPPALLSAVRDSLKHISEDLNSYIILGTATQPQLNKSVEAEEEKLEPFKLFSPNESKKLDGEDLDKFFNRYYLNTSLLGREWTIKDLEDLLGEDTKLSNFMVVLNTIGSTKKIYRDLNDNPDFDNYEIIYLSTNIPPVERKKRIDRAKNLIKKNKRFILVTTQLIEAGVDISVEKIYRDMAPLDKIVQTAGRTNRNNEKEFSEVVVFELIDKENRPATYSSYIYDNVLLSKTRRILEEYGDEIEEKDLYSNILPVYFDFVINENSQGTFKSSEGNKINLKKQISGLQYDKVDRFFRLIKEDLPEISCFILQDSKGKEIWEEYCKISKIPVKSWEEYVNKKERFSKIKREFNRRIVTLRVGSKEEKEDLKQIIIVNSEIPNRESNSIYCIDNENDKLYDENTGLTVKENDSAMVL